MSILIMNCRVFKSCFFSKWIIDKILGSTFLSRCSRTLHQSTQQCSKNSNEVQKTNICCTIIIWNCWNKSLHNKLTHRSVKFVDTFSCKNLVEFYFFRTLCKLSNKMFFDKHHWKLGQVYCLYYINNPAKQCVLHAA